MLAYEPNVTHCPLRHEVLLSDVRAEQGLETLRLVPRGSGVGTLLNHFSEQTGSYRNSGSGEVRQLFLILTALLQFDQGIYVLFITQKLEMLQINREFPAEGPDKFTGVNLFSQQFVDKL